MWKNEWIRWIFTTINNKQHELLYSRLKNLIKSHKKNQGSLFFIGNWLFITKIGHIYEDCRKMLEKGIK
jgi:hypothetical protein